MGGVTSTGLPRHPSRRLNLWLVALALVLLTGCQKEMVSLSIDPLTDSQEEGLWLSIDPTQCLTNPWDLDWLLTHDYDDYPRTQSGAIAIFRDYYADQGLVIHDVRVEQVYDVVCAACGCPTGERFYILVDEADERAFLETCFEGIEGQVCFVKEDGPP